MSAQQVSENLPLVAPVFDDPDHHLWRNGRLWWVAYTVHLPGWRKERVRRSLGTTDLHEARRLRDALFASYGPEGPVRLSLRPGRREVVRGPRPV